MKEKGVDIKQMRNLVMIPARSGSKGLTDKNIKDLQGKPLMAYTIEAAFASGMFDTVHVSTDSGAYAEIARDYGADVPFFREAGLASDTSSVWDAVRFVLETYRLYGKMFDTVALLQPTSPLRTALHIREAFAIFQKKQAEAVVSVCEAEHSPLLYGQLGENDSMKEFIGKNVYSQPRQLLTPYYRLNGSIYLLRTEILYQYSSIYDSNIFAYIMPQECSIDIDNPLDFKFAEFLLSNKNKEPKET